MREVTKNRKWKYETMAQPEYSYKKIEQVLN